MSINSSGSQGQLERVYQILGTTTTLMLTRWRARKVVFEEGVVL